MQAPLFGSAPHDWLRELNTSDLLHLELGLLRLLTNRPNAFVLFKARGMLSAVQCLLLERSNQHRSAA
ncbi:hypothetical protein [Chitinilyticum litopenaei]|uniref:hypothetical protein n=1 Tax=Chitinilyticum litopenaei TaxID=1121276 RepID=UPI000429AE8A|nr:hypothetical protein [Chitinilyticum litopenaei]